MEGTYEQEVLRTYGGRDALPEMLMLGALGLAGEAGEIADIVKKWVYHDHPLNSDRLGEELGDALWYLTLLAMAEGYSLMDIMARNVEKLRRRYPDGFDATRSWNRSEFEG